MRRLPEVQAVTQNLPAITEASASPQSASRCSRAPTEAHRQHSLGSSGLGGWGKRGRLTVLLSQRGPWEAYEAVCKPSPWP